MNENKKQCNNIRKDENGYLWLCQDDGKIFGLCNGHKQLERMLNNGDVE